MYHQTLVFPILKLQQQLDRSSLPNRNTKSSFIGVSEVPHGILSPKVLMPVIDNVKLITSRSLGISSTYDFLGGKNESEGQIRTIYHVIVFD